MAPEPAGRESRRRWRSTRLMLTTQTGAFAAGLSEAGAFARATADAEAPDTQFHFVAVDFLDDRLTGAGEAQGAWISPCLLTPQSRGSVRLASGDPADAPTVHNAFYSAAADLQRMLAALRLALEISGKPAISRYCAEPFTAPQDVTTDRLREHIARTTFAFYHPVGTCRMGHDSDAVLDPHLRVNGLEGLRVVDASVMPAVPRGNTNAPTIAIAERAADLIRYGRALSAPIVMQPSR